MISIKCVVIESSPLIKVGQGLESHTYKRAELRTYWYAIRGSLHLGKGSGGGDVKFEEEGALQPGGLSFNLPKYLPT